MIAAKREEKLESVRWGMLARTIFPQARIASRQEPAIAQKSASRG
jgi:hypothetical protein